MSKKNILFVLAHMDDEVYSSGTIMKLIEDGHNIHLLTICGLGRSVEKHTNHSRIQAWKKIGKELKLSNQISLEFYDLSLKNLNESDELLVKLTIEREIKTRGIDWVFTNCSEDQHSDHRIVSEITRLCCREDRSSIKKLIECYIPGSTERGKENINNFNISIGIDKYVAKKREFLKLYGTELSNSNSVDSTMIGNMYFGNLSGQGSAEIFKLVYEKCF